MTRVDLAGKLSDARDRVDAEGPPEGRGLAMYARLTRKDARIRADQDVALTALAKTLMRRRAVKSERITENTLIRVAIDLLLAHADELRGSTEDHLRDSVTCATPQPQTSGLPPSDRSELPDSHSPEVPAPRTTGHSRSRSLVVGEFVTAGAAVGCTRAERRDAEPSGRAARSEVQR